MNEKDNLKEKFKQALISTVKVISDDHKLEKDINKNLSSKNYNFFELDNLNTTEDYIKLRAETDSEALKEYERIMGLNEDVLRFLNVRIEEVEEGPSIMMQAKTERPQRVGRDDRDDHDGGNSSANVEVNSNNFVDEKREG